MQKQIIKFLTSGSCAIDCVLAALATIPLLITRHVSKSSDHNSRLEELYANHENIIRSSALPNATKQNLLGSLHSSQSLEGVKEVLASDFQMISNDMQNAIKQYVNRT